MLACRAPVFRKSHFHKIRKMLTLSTFPAAARLELSFIMCLHVSFLMGTLWNLPNTSNLVPVVRLFSETDV